MTLRDRIEAQTRFEASIRNNLIELLLAIKRYSLENEESRAWMSRMSDTFRAFFNCVQEENETLSDYNRRFKAAREILQSHLGGPTLVTKAMEDTCQ